MRKGLVSVVLSVCSAAARLPARAPALVEVRGVLRDSGSRAPIYGARVILAAGRTATTDSAGRFTVQLPRGSYQVLVLCGNDPATPTYGWPARRLDVRDSGAATLRLDAPAGACTPARGAIAPPPVTRWCEAAPAQAAPGMTLSGVTGAFALQVVATAGPGRGRAVDGELRLEALPDADRSARSASAPEAPAEAWLRLDLRPIGAHVWGEIDDRVGGVVLEYPQGQGTSALGPRIMLFLQGAGLEPGTVVSDGPYTWLRVTDRTATSLAGQWESGILASPHASGYFCARRTGR